MKENELRFFLKELGIRVADSREYENSKLLIASCPFAPYLHERKQDTKPSFAAFVHDKGRSSYYCQACHSSGNITTLIKDLSEYRDENYALLSMKAEQIELADAFIVPPYEELYEDGEHMPEPVDETVYSCLFDSAVEHQSAVDYLEGRDISCATADNLGLLFDDEEDRILFPVRDAQSRFYGYTGRLIYPHEYKVKVKDYAGLKKKHFVLGEERWDHGKPLIIVEGLFAYAHLHEIGMEQHANIGALLGSNMSKYKAERIADLNEPTYLLLDNDKAGDIGLFGPRRGKPGAVDLLIDHIPVYVPDWSMFGDIWSCDKQSFVEKDDPDQLTKDELMYMVDNCPLYMNC